MYCGVIRCNNVCRYLQCGLLFSIYIYITVDFAKSVIIIVITLISHNKIILSVYLIYDICRYMFMFVYSLVYIHVRASVLRVPEKSET